jgi:hypothetical protein
LWCWSQKNTCSKCSKKLEQNSKWLLMLLFILEPGRKIHDKLNVPATGFC